MPSLANAVLLGSLIVTHLSVPTRAQVTAVEAELAAFDAEVATGVARDAGGMVAVAVFEGDSVVWSKGWGWADLERRVAATAHTIGRTGSISKSFTSILMMRLAERGVLDLDEAVSHHLPEIQRLSRPPDGAGLITFRQLASHTAGLEREPLLEDAAVGPIDRWEAKVVESIAQTGFASRPGTAYAYSNIGVGILGLALSRAAGAPYMALMDSLVFAPLGLGSTTFVIDRPDRWARLAVGYDRTATGGVSSAAAAQEHAGRGYKVPNGGVYSTVGDLARLAGAMMGRSVPGFLSDSARLAMLRAQAPAEAYGLGFMLWRLDGELLAGHAGCVAGYDAFLVFHPTSGVGAAVLRTTTYEPPARELVLRLLAARAPGAVPATNHPGYRIRRLPVDECVEP
jgi:CubicO group peptidase (beta-lactamase class C family)